MSFINFSTINLKRRRKSNELFIDSIKNQGVLSVHFVGTQLAVWFKCGIFAVFDENLTDPKCHFSKYVGFCKSSVLITERLNKDDKMKEFTKQSLPSPRFPKSRPGIPLPPISIPTPPAPRERCPEENVPIKNPEYSKTPFLALVPNSTEQNDFHGIDVINNLNHRESRAYLQNEGVPMSCKLLNRHEYLVGFESGKIIKFSTDSDKILATRQVAKPGIPIMTMCVGGENNRLIIAGSAENILYKLDQELNICSEIELTNSGLNDVCICDDGTSIVVTLGWDKRIRVFDAGEKNSDVFCKLAVINCDEYLHSSNLQSAVFLKEKGMLITGSLDGRISGWNNFTGKFIE